MKKSQLNRELIESLNESNNVEFIENINNFVFELTESVLNDISAKSPFIKTEKCVILPVNEAYLGTYAQLSDFAYFVGVENPQIELNTKTKSKIWKYLLREFRAGFRLGRKKYKKTKNVVTHEPITKYKLSDFRHDFVNYAAEYLTETSLITEFYNHITMIGQNDFGTSVKINIYFCSYDSKTNIFKLPKETRNKFFEADFGDRFKNLDHKIEKCGERFIDMVKIYNALFSKNFNRIPNQIMVESLLYACPDILFDADDLFKTFVNVSNYIRFAGPQTLYSICDSTKTIFQDPLITKRNNHLDFSKIITMLDNFKY